MIFAVDMGYTLEDKMEVGRWELAHSRTAYRLTGDAANAASSSEL